MLPQAAKKGRFYVCSTGELNGLNIRLQDVAKDALLLSIMVADGVMVSVRDALPALTAFSEAVSLLDVIVNAFATTVSGSTLPFVRPRLTLDGPLAIGNGRHPVACAHMRAEGREFVANSTFLSDAASFGVFCVCTVIKCNGTEPCVLPVVITGANMSGKTTYLKQVSFRLSGRGCFFLTAHTRLLSTLCSRMLAALSRRSLRRSGCWTAFFRDLAALTTVLTPLPL